MNKIVYFALFLLGLFLFTQCDNGEDVDPNSLISNTETVNAVEKSSANEEAIDFNIDRYLAEIIQNGRTPSYKKDLNDCTTVDIDTTSTGLFFTITFDEGGCEDEFGNLHVGGLTANVMVTDGGFIIDKNFSTYAFNGVSVVGTIHSEVSSNEEDQRVIDRMAELTLTNADEIVNNRTSNYTITLIAGDGDLDYTNDVYSITGGSTNELSTGVTWTVTNLVAVERPGSCNFYAVSGKKNVVNASQATSFLIDYGEGECDGVATITLPSGEQITYNQF